jgi:hypothetical protein
MVYLQWQGAQKLTRFQPDDLYVFYLPLEGIIQERINQSEPIFSSITTAHLFSPQQDLTGQISSRGQGISVCIPHQRLHQELINLSAKYLKINLKWINVKTYTEKAIDANEKTIIQILLVVSGVLEYMHKKGIAQQYEKFQIEFFYLMCHHIFYKGYNRVQFFSTPKNQQPCVQANVHSRENNRHQSIKYTHILPLLFP